MSKFKLLGIAGSLRRHSTNKGLLRAAKASLPDDVTMEVADLLQVPLFNPDFPDPPPSVRRVFDQMAEADGFVLAATEYNYSVAPALKNILDWASRVPGNALLCGKPAAMLGAGGPMGTGIGTARAQYHLRQICVFLDLRVLNKPEVFVNAYAGGFDEEGNLTDPAVIEAVAAQMQALRCALKLN
ncbi:NADPH-dependent FMN reductase [Uliginosibacterium aquaticum]|uniref:NAD(P)H-dependent oxidoreductase n=1 Tax=Uliginosibacterium aquaticum TaxID=2731212 RepID=A0ABX2IJX4_9RHOO|nr:NAD(P)H-dependent oxidoreductase [Uliginosibacterium aquaticum]NSL54611.1 NAD(P)H-dependent oxidoreductase [Uliginosibacterium aquaticum]